MTTMNCSTVETRTITGNKSESRYHIECVFKKPFMKFIQDVIHFQNNFSKIELLSNIFFVLLFWMCTYNLRKSLLRYFLTASMIPISVGLFSTILRCGLIMNGSRPKGHLLYNFIDVEYNVYDSGQYTFTLGSVMFSFITMYEMKRQSLVNDCVVRMMFFALPIICITLCGFRLLQPYSSLHIFATDVLWFIGIITVFLLIVYYFTVITYCVLRNFVNDEHLIWLDIKRMIRITIFMIFMPIHLISELGGLLEFIDKQEYMITIGRFIHGLTPTLIVVLVFCCFPEYREFPGQLLDQLNIRRKRGAQLQRDESQESTTTDPKQVDFQMQPLIV